MGLKFSVNDDRIYYKKYYPYQLSDNLKVNLVPISFYTHLQARITLEGQFGKNWYTEVKIIRGEIAKTKGWKLGKNSVIFDNRRYQVRKILIPTEYAYNRGMRFVFRRKLYKILKIGKRSMINRFLKKYYTWTIN